MKNSKVMALCITLALLVSSAHADEIRSRMLIDDTMPQSRVLEIVDAAQMQSLQPGNPVSLNLQVQFSLNDTRLSPSSAVILDRVATALRSRGAATDLVIEAHTDSIGSQAYNLGLSKRRAEAVLLYLIGAGVPASQMSAVGYGETRPLPGTNPMDGLNRRAEILLVN